MNVLFIHQNYPGQYLHLARHLGARPDRRVWFLTQRTGPEIPGVTQLSYQAEVGAAHLPGRLGCHPFNYMHDAAVRTGLAALAACRALRDSGVTPDIVIGHSGWGETLLVKQAFPHTPLLVYLEYFYRDAGADVGYDREFSPARADDPERLWLRNSITHLSLEGCDAAHTATPWQRSQFPAHWRDRIQVLHEGVDCAEVCPDPQARFSLPSGRELSREDEVITFVARSLEPYRGFHCLMRALPEVLRARPKAHVLIAGGDDVSYGNPPPYGGSWRQLMLSELGGRLDLSRVHFLGTLPRERYLRLLQVSSLHVYFSYPFVLSWSCVEAMAAGCLLLGSDVPSVRDVLEEGRNGWLVDMLDAQAVAGRMIQALDSASALAHLRQQARRDAVARFDLRAVALPAWLRAIESLRGACG